MRAALNPPPKWKAYMDARQQRVRSYQAGGEVGEDDDEPEGMSLDEFLQSQPAQSAQRTEDVTGSAQGMSLDQFLQSQQQEPELPQLHKGLLGGAEAAGISAGRRIVPAAGAFATGLAGAEAGAAAGAALAPVTGGLSIPVGALIGGIGGGLAGGFGGGYLADWMQDKVLDALGLKETVQKYGAAAEKQFPKTSFVAGLAPDVAAFSTGNVGTGARLASAALQGAGEAASEYFDKGEVSPGKVLTATGAGLVFAKPRAGLSRAVEAIPGVKAAQQYSQTAVAGAERAAQRRGRFTERAPEEAAGEAPGEAPEQPRTQVPEGVGVATEPEPQPLDWEKLKGVDLNEPGVPVRDTPEGAQAQQDAQAVSRAPTAPGTSAQEPPPVAADVPAPPYPEFGKRTAGPRTEFAPERSATRYPKFGKRTAAAAEPTGTIGDVHPDVEAAFAAKNDAAAYVEQKAGAAEPDYFAKPPTSTEYPHGDEDMSHVTLNRERDVPGKVTSDPSDPNKVYVDRNLPPTVDVGGKPIDPAFPLGVRENTRRQISDTLAKIRENFPEHFPAAEQHEAVANAAGAEAQRQWLHQKGYDDGAFKTAIGEARPEAPAPSAAPAAEAPRAAPVPPPEPVAPAAAEPAAAAPPAPRAEIPPPAETTGTLPPAAPAPSRPVIEEGIPDFLRTGSEAPPPPAPAQAPKVNDPAFAAYLARRAEGAAKDAAAREALQAELAERKRTTDRARIGKMKAAKAGDTTRMPLSGKAAAQAIRERAAGEQIEQQRQQGLVGTIKDFGKDESGGGPPIPFEKIFKMLTSQGGAYVDPNKVLGRARIGAKSSTAAPREGFGLRERYAPPKDTWRTRKARSEQEALGNTVSDDLHRFNQRNVSDNIDLTKRVTDLTGNDQKMMANTAAQQQMYRAREAGKTDALAQPVRKFYDKHIKPLFDDSADKYTRIKALTKDWDEAERAEFLQDLDPTHLHRMAIGHNAAWDAVVSGQSADPVEGIVRGLKTNPSSLQSRKFFAIEDAQGKRTVVTPTKEGLTLWNKGNETHVTHEGPFEVGNKITIDGKEYTAKQALTHEIKANARFADGKMADYHENAFLSAMEENRTLSSALRHLEYLEDIKANPKFQQYTVDLNEKGKNKDAQRREAQRRGYQESTMPQMRGIAMDPFLKAAFDDFTKPGLGSSALDGFRRVSQAATKTLFFTPVPHSLNAFWHWWVGRGWDWLKPTEYGRLMPELMQAFRSVTTQDALQKAIRDAGGGSVLGGVLTNNMARNLAGGIGLDMKANPSKWVQLAETMGLGHGAQAAENLLRGIYDWSSKSMWTVNDTLLTHQIMVNQRNGMSLEKAIGHAEQHIPNYRMPLTIMGSRNFQKVLSDPAAVAFGRYHYGVYNSLARMVKGLAFGDMEQRKEAAGNLFALALFAGVMKPLVLDPMVKALTGDKEAETAPRGPLSPLTAAKDVIEGRKGVESLEGGAITLTPMLSAMLQMYGNKDYTGHPIINPAASLPTQIAEAGDQFLRGTIAPYGTWANALNRYPGADPGTIAAKALGSQFVDIKTKKPGADVNALKAIAREENTRRKTPKGPLESLSRYLGG